MELDLTEMQGLEKKWVRCLDKTKDLLMRCNEIEKLSECKVDLIASRANLMDFQSLHKDTIVSIDLNTVSKDHEELVILITARIQALDDVDVSRRSGMSHKSNISHRSALSVEEEGRLSEVDLRYLGEQNRLENELKVLAANRSIERGKALSSIRSSLDPQANLFVPLDCNLKKETQVGSGNNIGSICTHCSCSSNTHQVNTQSITHTRDSHMHPPQLFSNITSEYQGMCTQDRHNNQPIVPSPNQQVLLSRLAMPTPRKFSGDPLQFAAWRNSFETLIVQSGMPAKERLYYLEQCLDPTGDPWEGIQGYFALSSETAYFEAMSQLEYRYGNKHVIGAAHRNKLYEWPKILERDNIGIRKLADFAKQCLIAKQTHNSLDILDDESEHLKVLTKLPDSLLSRWTRRVNEARNRGSVFPLFEKFTEFLVAESQIACDPVLSIAAVKAVSPQIPYKGNNSQASNVRYNSTVHSTTTNNYEVKANCSYCKTSTHHTENCRRIPKLSVSEIRDFVMINRLCWSCLKEGHTARFCRNRLTCSTCHYNHPTVLHLVQSYRSRSHQPSGGVNVDQGNDTNIGSGINQKELVDSASKVQDTVCHYVSHHDTDRCSMIVPVYISHSSNPSKEVLVYCLLDSQSDTSFVRSDVMKSLGIEGQRVILSLSTMSSQNQTVESTAIEGLIVRGYDKESCNNRISLPRLYSRDIMPANRGHIPTGDKIRHIPKLSWLGDVLSEELDIPVAMLIGYNCASALRPIRVISSGNSSLYAQRSTLGWGVVGLVRYSNNDMDDVGISHTTTAYEVKSVDNSRYSTICFNTSIKEMFTPVDCRKLLEQDFTNTDSDLPYSVEDTRFLSIVNNNTRQQEDGHYVLPLPFRDVDKPVFPSNSRVALHRLSKLKERFKKDPRYYKDYCKVIDGYIGQGHASLVSHSKSSISNSPGQSWFLPHHGVYHVRKLDKLRVVFDGSARCQGTSLNDQLLSGPDLINSLTGILCRFRQEYVAFSVDISEMFHQFVVEESYRDYLRFYWYQNNDYNREPSVYRMNKHIFGSTSSPACANYCLKRIASDYENSSNQVACNFMRKSFYVDDGLLSVPTTDQAIDVINMTKDICAKGGLKLHKFVSNSAEVRKVLDAECERNRVTFIERTLGVTWCVESDALQFRILIDSKPCTRRGVLSIVSSIFDPLGLVGPYILEGKILLQEICTNGTRWDDSIPDHLLVRWKKWLTLIVNLDELVIPRCYKSDSLSEIKEIQLHHFSDASNKAYGQCSYVRFVDINNKVWCSLVIGKSRVAPTKVISIPRLELTAAVLSVKVSMFLKRESDYKEVAEYFWSDSTVTLSYIRNEARRFHTFVANRIQQIRDNSNVSAWLYVPTEHNPADDASRGLDLSKVDSESRWFQGPQFLWNSSWQEFISPISILELQPDDSEVKGTVFSSNVVEPYDILGRLSTLSSWIKVRKTVAIWLRYMTNLRSKYRIYTGVLKVEELIGAENSIIRLIQCSYFAEEISSLSKGKVVSGGSALSRLNPFTDDNGLIRVGGRLLESNLLYSVKHPIVLPQYKKCDIVKLLIGYFHGRVKHQGRSATVNRIRDSGYWIIACISGVASVIYNCITCRRLYSSPVPQQMSDLPTDRLTVVPPFTYCAVDIFGPYIVKEGRKCLKRYGVIFVCLSCKGVHIEVAHSLTTDSFINAFRRLVATRGAVRSLRSDCGTNFVGADRELRSEIEKLDHDRIEKQLMHESCDYTVFKFNKPHASHTGGVWERQIRSVRRVMSSLLSSLGNQLDDESLYTFLCEAAGIINSRPLYVDTLADVNSPTPISPNSIMTMKSSVVVPPPGNFEEEQSYTKRRWRNVQFLSEQFWRRWRKEYILNLQARSKWHRPKRNFKIGDIVMLVDELAARCNWSVCRISEVFESKDGLVRSVRLVVGNKSLNDKGIPKSSPSVFDRSVHKIILLLAAE